LSDIFVRKYRERVDVYMNNKSLVRYNLQLSYLAQLRDKSLITEEEYKKILDSLKKDYKVISNRFC
jgi:septum formation inhibitor-activating ATPase MinD